MPSRIVAAGAPVFMLALVPFALGEHVQARNTQAENAQVRTAQAQNVNSQTTPVQIGPRLQWLIDRLEPGHKVKIVVQLGERVPIDRFAAERNFGTNRNDRRESLIRALRSKAVSTQQPLHEFLLSRGATQIVSLWMINGIALEADVSLIRELASRPEIESIRLDRAIKLEPEREDLRRRPAPIVRAAVGTGTPEWNIAMVRAPELWANGLTGQGVVVAGLDSGVLVSHPDLVGRYRGGTNSWFDPYGQDATPHDASGHGTQTMGLIVGGDADGTSIGVAPGAQWIAAKVFDNSGEALFSAIHQAFGWVLDPDGDPATDDAADVVNSSWGLADNIDECVLDFQLDVQTLKAAGIAVVFSAGNSGPGSATSLSPANNPNGFAVGMVGSGMAVDAQSSRGPSTCDGAIFPEVVAPGVFVWTSDLTGGYVEELGTSFAAPHVAGAMALLKQAYPGATVEELEFVLRDTAVDLGVTGPDNAAGQGLIDIVEARLAIASLPCSDGDGDGFGVGANCLVRDCDDLNLDVWRAPGEASNLLFVNGTTLSWSPPASSGGTPTSTFYDTLRSSDPSDFTFGSTCLESEDSDLDAEDQQVPAPGQLFYYLVRGVNACPQGSGPLGQGSAGGQRTAGACP